jgi:hypothetical protein
MDLWRVYFICMYVFFVYCKHSYLFWQRVTTSDLPNITIKVSSVYCLYLGYKQLENSEEHKVSTRGLFSLIWYWWFVCSNCGNILVTCSYKYGLWILSGLRIHDMYSRGLVNDFLTFNQCRVANYIMSNHINLYVSLKL